MSRLQQYIQSTKQKAGIIPFHIDNKGVLSVLLTKPSDPDYGGSNYQIAKGGIDEGETLEQTALREGIEELGLREYNTIGMLYMGFDNIQDYELHVYLTRVKNRQDFNKPHYETDSTKWFTRNELGNVREEQRPLIQRCFGKWFFMNEWKVHKQYSGRDMIVPNKTVLWQYIPSKGLLHTYHDGTTFLDGREIGDMVSSSDSKATHKKQLASFYSKLGFTEPNMRQWIENNYESFVRGRIVGNDLYVYSSGYVGIEAKKYDKMVDRAIDAIYDYAKDV
jgi:8-oxo-dGTP pyrophosphatase MutT (NUDIX family)